MANKITVKDEAKVFTLSEEREFFRLTADRPDINEEHVEDFTDTTIEWLSSNPHKGLLIDFDGVRTVCADFTVQLTRYYEDIKAKGLYVRFVNVDPRIQSFIDVSNITVVISLSDLPREKPALSAAAVLTDLGRGMSNRELRKKHRLTDKGLESLFLKLKEKGLISRKTLSARLGLDKSGKSKTAAASAGEKSKKVTVRADEVLKDFQDGLSDEEIMKKYSVAGKGLERLMRELLRKGIVPGDDQGDVAETVGE